MDKFEYVKGMCSVDYDKSDGVITNEAIIGNFAGRGFCCSSLDDGVWKIVEYFDEEQRVVYKGKATSVVQDALKEIGWGVRIL